MSEKKVKNTTATQALWRSFSILCLQDDFSPISIDQSLTLSEALRQLVKNAKPLQKMAPPAATRLQNPLLKNESKKLFSADQSLRDMMEEYNRPRANSRTLIKAGSSRGFDHASLETIRIPAIPGKILRPS